MGQGSEESEKFPAVLEYANARHEFDAPTEANLAWVWDLLCASGWVPQPADTPRHIWEELRIHQSRLVAWLEHIIAKRPNLIAGRVVVEQRVRHWAAQLVFCVRSETSDPQTISIHGLSHSMRPRTRDRIFANETPPPEHEIPQEVLSSQDCPPRFHPLMVLYRQLTRLFQENGKKWFHKCPSCKLFFLPLTTRAQACCSDACWGQWHPITPEANRGYQRTSRNLRKQLHLKRIQIAINTVYAGLTRQQDGRGDELTLEGVPADVLADYVYEKVWTQVKKFRKRKIGPRVCKKLMNAPELSRKAQRQLVGLTRGTLPQHAVKDEAR